MITSLLYVALGGAMGAVARFILTTTITRTVSGMGAGFPLGTLSVNVLGSLFMGILSAYLLSKGNQQLQPLLLTGLLGGFTTFSAFSLDAVSLIERGQIAPAMIYIFGSVVLSIASLALGLIFARTVFL